MRKVHSVLMNLSRMLQSGYVENSWINFIIHMFCVLQLNIFTFISSAHFKPLNDLHLAL